MSDNFFIEIDSRQICAKGSIISGNVCITKKHNGRTVVVLSDGGSSGIQTNVVASIIASMAINYSLAGEDPIRAAKAIIETFVRKDAKRAKFTIITICDSGNVTMVEFGNPEVVVVRDGEIFEISREKHNFKTETGIDLSIFYSDFFAQCEDRILSFTDGVTLSGYATFRMPQGFKIDGVRKMILATLAKTPHISGADLALTIIASSEMNDLFVVKNDMSCASIYFRKPRRILVCTGPPFNAEKDKELAELVNNYDGDTIISGGTTSQIIARELKRDISVIMKRDSSSLPPISKMEGVTMVTEGVLTLAKVKAMLESLKSSDIKENGIDAVYVKLLLQHDEINFIVGSRINAVHQDPSLPIELELRRNVIKEIGRLLETKFMKQINIKYI
ncbi:MAG: SpoIIE family protein phosphatase [Rikenellaceae bacterium]